MPTMRDVAHVAGVSAKTVSRVFNNDPHVTPETRDRVQWAIARLNYVPNMLARSFRAGADAAVGLAFPDISDPFFAAMARSIEHSLTDRNMAVVVTSLGLDPAREPAALETLLRRQISGMIVATIGRDQSYLQPWYERTPMVFVDRAPRGLAAISVIEDDVSGARESVAHLARHGHHRIALLGVSTYVSTTRRRLEGYRAAVTALGLGYDDALICMHNESAEGAAAEFIKLLDTTHPPTAVFSLSIPCTMALVHALQQASRRDIAVVGFGDFPMADAVTPAITVIDQNPAEVGRVAVDRLTKLLANPQIKQRRRTVLPVQLIPRGSGEIPAPPDPVH